MSALKKLTISNLRGCTKPFPLPFEAGKKLTVVYGENATGKSTICDSLEFIGKGKIGSLENRGLGRTESYWPSLGKKPADIVVTLEMATGSCVGKVTTGEVVVHPGALRPRVEVLRRAQILSLVEARPADKYSAIERFIDVRGPESSETNLRRLIDSLVDSQSVAVARVAENQATIEQSWSIDGKPGANAFAWAEQQSNIDTKVFAGESSQIEALILSFQRLKDAVDKVPSVKDALGQSTEAVTKAKGALDLAIESATDGASDEVPILEAAKNYLHKHANPSACPLCESAEKVADLDTRVQARLQAFKTLRDAHVALKTAETANQSATTRFNTVAESVTQRAQEFETLRSTFTWPSDVPAVATTTPTSIKTLPAWIATVDQLLPKWKAAKDSRADKHRFVASVVSALKTYRQNVKEQKALEVLLPKLKATLKIAEDERRTFTDEILSGIAVNVGKLYEAVHPGEGLDKISLALDPKKRASLDIGSSFAGQGGLPPQAYFSESHLDTLGLCVFLALAEIDGPADTILVLDDVLASVDEPHVERLIEMLYAEAAKFRHCVITTHYRPWKLKLRWGWLKNGECQFIELSKWSVDGGMKLIRSVPDVEALRELLAATPSDPQTISAKAGVILEAALDFITTLYQCSIPRKADGLYTLGDLLPSIDKKLKAALRVEVLTGKDTAGIGIYDVRPLAPYLDKLTNMAQVRNVMGCHFNKLSFDLLESDAHEFGKQVLGLIETLTDTETGWPKSDKSGSYWATGKETRRLHPLKKPS